MLTRPGLLSPVSRGLMAAMVAVLLLTLPEPRMAAAGALPPASEAASATAGVSDATDFSARRRRYYRRNNAAGLAFFGMALGTIGAIAAQQQRNDYYNNYNYNYGYGPGYYGGDPYYGRRYYRRY